MRFISGVVCGMLLLVLAAFIADSWTTQDNPPSPCRSDRIVNWDVAGERIYSSVESIRERIHELTR